MLEQSRKAVELPHVNHAAAPFFFVWPDAENGT
jgi:hypothetical protein